MRQRQSEKLEKLDHLLRSQVVAKAIQENLGLSPAEIEAITTKLKALWMARTQGLTVGGGLNLYGTKIKELPQGLTVGGDLDLSGTQIKELPQALKVKKAIYVDDKSKIKCSDELRKKLR